MDIRFMYDCLPQNHGLQSYLTNHDMNHEYDWKLSDKKTPLAPPSPLYMYESAEDTYSTKIISGK